MSPPAPPRWLPWCCAAVMLTGLGLFVGGPILSMAIAAASADTRLSPEERLDPERRQQAYEEALAERRESDAWVIPVGMGLAGMGTMSLLFVFVTRPLGGDLDPPPSGSGGEEVSNDSG